MMLRRKALNQYRVCVQLVILTYSAMTEYYGILVWF